MPRLSRLKDLNHRRMELALRALAYQALIELHPTAEGTVQLVVDHGLAKIAMDDWSKAEREFILCLRECTRDELVALVEERE